MIHNDLCRAVRDVQFTQPFQKLPLYQSRLFWRWVGRLGFADRAGMAIATQPALAVFALRVLIA
ncbi:hypothetical protein [Microvirga mediterraneensis]|uniref:Uncharacterized protein n=1 Tax=Microvirga mediterraneensis TaxID=2754695 RepID=A0A838BU27_9HYPH|nr:hypothetical protein [Microvirga mediterraneensis]MBA1159364.1 hypothetical protein [Microvirga mediterraneensis]